MLNQDKRSSWQDRKRRVLFVLAQLTVLAVIATATQAFAQLPGEWSSYGHETAVDPNCSGPCAGDHVKLQYTYSEARNNGHLLSVWRGLTDTQVWMSYDNNGPFTIGQTQTFTSPTVVPWSGSSFMVFHTGVDGGIYYTVVVDGGNNYGRWSTFRAISQI